MQAGLRAREMYTAYLGNKDSYMCTLFLVSQFLLNKFIKLWSVVLFLFFCSHACDNQRQYMNYKLRFFGVLALLRFLFCNFTFLIHNCLWVVCDVFLVPPKSYAEVLNPMAGKKILSSQLHLSPSNKTKLCPFQEAGECKYGSQCVYIHGDTCDLCGHACLHPQDKEQRKKHINVSSDITTLPDLTAVLW